MSPWFGRRPWLLGSIGEVALEFGDGGETGVVLSGGDMRPSGVVDEKRTNVALEGGF